MTRTTFATGERVKLWVGLELMWYPKEGIVKQYLEDHPGGPAYKVAFDDGGIAYVKREWVFP